MGVEMKHRNTIYGLLCLFFSGGIAIGSAVPVVAAPDGARLAAEKCEACHGKNGNSEKEDVPSIAGFSDVMIGDSLAMFQSGERKGGKYEVDGKEIGMDEIAGDLSEEDIEVLAMFYAEQTFQPRPQAFDAALAEQGAEIHDRKCENCHSEQGGNADDDAAILAGQWIPYMRAQYAAFRSGEREAPKKMEKKLDSLNDEDIEALINFYASQQ
jgi:sulfide dehydrogenase cytochrome subunit